MLKYKSLLVLLFLLCAGNAYATIAGDGSLSASYALPRGYQKATICTLVMTTVIDGESIESITIKNNGPVAFGPKAISKVAMDVQIGDDPAVAAVPMAEKSFSTTENTWTFSGLTNATFGVAPNKKTIAIYYTIAENAAIEATANFVLGDVIVREGGVTRNLTVTGISSGRDYPITGMDAILDKSYTPKFVIPGSTMVPYAYFSVIPKGESFVGNFQLILNNEDGSFDNGNLSKGIVKAYLYVDTANIGQFEPNLDRYVIYNAASTMTKPEQMEIVGNIGPLAKNTTCNIFIVFDIGSQTSIGDVIGINTKKVDAKKLYFQIKSFTALGADSNLGISMLDLNSYSISLPAFPRDADYATKLGGLMLDEYVSIVPPGYIGKGDTDIPIARFSLSARELALTVNALTFVNTGNIGFVSDSTKKNGVTVISLYRDMSRDFTFNGASKEDLIMSWPLGSYNPYLNQTNTSSKVTLSGLNVRLSTTNVNTDKSMDDLGMTQERFFVVYSLGDDISLVGSASIMASNLIDAKSSSNLIVMPVFLSGASDTNNIVATVSVTTIKISDVTSIIPPAVCELSENVPIMSYLLESSSDLVNVQVKLLSNTGAFYNNNKGLVSLSLYRDTGDGLFGPGDILEGVVDNFVDPYRMTLPPVDINSSITAKYFVVANIGAAAAGSFPLQVDSIISTNDMKGIIASGLFPKPDTPINLVVSANKVVINKVFSSTSLLAQGAGSIVDIVMTNANTFPITVNEISPVFLKDNIKGADISSEYIVSPSYLPFLLNAGSTVTMSFNLKTSNIRTAGKVFIDGACKYYSAVITANVTVKRHLDSVGDSVPAALITDSWIASISAPVIGAFPSYIESVREQGSTRNIQNKGILQKGNPIEISFINSGRDIAGGTLEVLINGLKLNQYSTSANYYVYSVATGKLTITSVKTGACDLLIKVKDTIGNQLEDMSFSYNVYDNSSNQIDISNLLVYPTPFLNDGSGLKIGFTLWADANVKLYMLNTQGHIVWHTELAGHTDYNPLTFDGVLDDGSKISTGAYILYAVAENAAGIKSKTKTKLAVW